MLPLGREKRERILALDPNGSPEGLFIELGTPVHQRLRFTQTHLIDLQAAIRALPRGERSRPSAASTS